MDISTIEVVDTFDVEILHPKTDEPILVKVDENDQSPDAAMKPMSITVYGPGSKAYKAAQAGNNAKALARIKAKGKVEAAPEEDAANTAAFLSAITVSFNGLDYKGRSEGREAFRALYLDPKMGWVTEQVNRAAGDWANFTTASPAS